MSPILWVSQGVSNSVHGAGCLPQLWGSPVLLLLSAFPSLLPQTVNLGFEEAQWGNEFGGKSSKRRRIILKEDVVDGRPAKPRSTSTRSLGFWGEHGGAALVGRGHHFEPPLEPRGAAYPCHAKYFRSFLVLNFGVLKHNMFL